jgi:murein DD-endopeptidase MepM/ murein hydrolase activator NlpD
LSAAASPAPTSSTASTTPSPSDRSSVSSSNPSSQPQSRSAQTPRQQLLAINTGEGGENQRPVSQISADQIATSAANQWYGASFPVEHFQAYTSPFGYRQSPDGGYSTEFHYGLDMAAPQGSYIRNWWTGKVVEVSDDSNCGTSVVVESGNWMHIYCHMQGHVEEAEKGRYMVDREGGIQIWEGQDIAAGARIGRVGMTGRTTGPHLHWGLKFDENWVDPALVLRAMYVSQQAAASAVTGGTQ